MSDGGLSEPRDALDYMRKNPFRAQSEQLTVISAVALSAGFTRNQSTPEAVCKLNIAKLLFLRLELKPDHQ